MVGIVFDLCRLQARTRVNYEEVSELQYADDCALIAEDPESLQQPLNCLAEVYTAMCVWCSIRTKLRLFSSSRDWSHLLAAGAQVISINGDELKNVPQFKYLGSILSAGCSMDEEIRSHSQQGNQDPRPTDSNKICGLPCSLPAHIVVLLWNVDPTPQACQATGALSYSMCAQDSWSHLAE